MLISGRHLQSLFIQLFQRGGELSGVRAAGVLRGKWRQCYRSNYPTRSLFSIHHMQRTFLGQHAGGRTKENRDFLPVPTSDGLDRRVFALAGPRSRLLLPSSEVRPLRVLSID